MLHVAEPLPGSHDPTNAVYQAEPQAIRVWTAIFIVVGIGWRVVRYALGFPFWGDEAFLNVSLLNRTFAELGKPLEYSQIAPVGYLWIQRAILETFGGGEHAMRLLGFVAGIAALLLFARVARRVLPPIAAVLAIGLFAVSYPLVRHAVESKPYGTDAFVSVLLVWIGVHWRQRPASLGWSLAAGAASCAAAWISYPAVFVGGGIVLAVLIAALPGRKAREVVPPVLCGVALTASFAAFYLLFARVQAQTAAGSWLEQYWNEGFPPAGGLAAFAQWLLRVHAGPMLAYPVGGQSYGSIATATLCAVGLLWFVRRCRSLLPILLAPAVLTMVAAAIHRYPYGGSARVAMHLAPAICVLAAVGMSVLVGVVRRPKPREALTGIAALFLLGVGIGGMGRDLLFPYKLVEYQEARQVMRQFAESLRPDDAVAIANRRDGNGAAGEAPWFHQSLRYYLELYTRVRPVWMEEQPAVPELDWVLAFRLDGAGPDRDAVQDWLAKAGLSIAAEREHALSTRRDATLVVYRCARVDRDTGAGAGEDSGERR